MGSPDQALAILVQHDGELADVVALLRELVGRGFVERTGAATREDLAVAWGVVVATPRRMVELQQDAGLNLAHAGTQRIAVLDKESRTLRSMLRRAGIELLVRRPVHPAALRLLLLHALYRGPEKRRSERVSVGAPIRYRCGFRRRNAILADLSVRGCRLLTRHSVERGKKLVVQIPGALGPGKNLSLRARVVRTAVAEDAEPGCETVAVMFEKLAPGALPLLRKAVKVHTLGPAALTGRAAAAAERPTPAVGVVPPVSVSPPPPAPQDERRTGERRTYDKRIIALSSEATRVVIGRDLSLGGMRIDPHDGLQLGDEVRLALHVRTREDPLVLDARVERDDGEDGMLLRFHGLSESAATYLTRMLNFLPILGSRLVDGDDEAGVIVSELLERESA